MKIEEYKNKAQGTERQNQAAEKAVTAKSSSCNFNESMEPGHSQLSSTPLPMLNYITKQSRTRKTPTMSQHKKSAVVAGLANYVRLSLEGKITRNVRQIQGLSNETNESKMDFYYRPDMHTMSRMNSNIRILNLENESYEDTI